MRNRNYKIIKNAKRFLVGGVDSPVRAFNYTGRDPIPIKKGRGPHVYDYDNKRYIDYVLSYGAIILGHADTDVIKGIKGNLSNGLGFGATHHFEVELAMLIRKAIPVMENVRFVTSGTEAVMGALRLARGVTGRRKILKFEKAYHGHSDQLLAKAGSGLATLNLPTSKGVPKEFVKHTLTLRYGDIKNIRKAFTKYGKDIAGVIVEPVGGNNGVTLPNIEFLKEIRTLTKKYKSLLIFDEIITGFRVNFGSAGKYLKIKPDIICLGKIIGGGLPIGAYGGSKRIMKHLAPIGKVYQASTFSGNPIVMIAGVTTLRSLLKRKKEYKSLEKLTTSLAESLKEEARKNEIDFTLRTFSSMFSVHFKNRKQFKIFHTTLLENGVFMAPSEYESNFLSFAHTRNDIKRTIESAIKAFKAIKKKR